MEERKITVISTKNQQKSVIMSSASTLGELKTDLRTAGIDYDNMVFYEGLTKIELKTDNSILPHDVPYKGQITNELVFMLTNTNKKIKSGALSRAEIYKEIKYKGLQVACLQKFGKNYTQCKTSDLESLIDSVNEANSPVKITPEAIETEIKEVEDTCKCENESSLKNAFKMLIDILEDSGTIEDYEYNDILNALNNNNCNVESENSLPKCKTSYSDNEIDAMFSDFK